MLNEIQQYSFHLIKRGISGVLLLSTNKKLAGIRMLNAKETVLKKINVLVIVHFSLDKYSFCFNSF